MLLSFLQDDCLIFLISTVIAQINDPTVELVITLETLINKAKAEIETHPLRTEKKTKFSKQFKTLLAFLYFSLNKSLCFIYSKR